VHAQRADEDGNVQLFGLPGDSVEGARASDRVIVTVEEIVLREEVRRTSDRTVLPGFSVAAVCEVPFGAYPSYASGYYGRDDDAYGAWDVLSRDAEKLQSWIDSEIRTVPDFATYLSRIESGRLKTLAAEYPERGEALR
jgi:glutaconate CoA-transferase, subunit A